MDVRECGKERMSFLVGLAEVENTVNHETNGPRKFGPLERKGKDEKGEEEEREKERQRRKKKGRKENKVGNKKQKVVTATQVIGNLASSSEGGTVTEE